MMNETEMLKKALEYIDASHEAMKTLWKEIVSMESGVSDKEGIDRVCERLKKELEEVKSSETYRLARLIGLPVRIFRRMFRKGIWRKYQ